MYLRIHAEKAHPTTWDEMREYISTPVGQYISNEWRCGRVYAHPTVETNDIYFSFIPPRKQPFGEAEQQELCDVVAEYLTSEGYSNISVTLD